MRRGKGLKQIVVLLVLSLIGFSVFVYGQLIIPNMQTKAKAATFDFNDQTTLANYAKIYPSTKNNQNKYTGIDIGLDMNKNLEGKDLDINGVTVAFDGTHSFNSVTVRNGGVLTHRAVDKSGKVNYPLNFFTARWKGFINVPDGVVKNNRTLVGLGINHNYGGKLGLKKVGDTHWEWWQNSWNRSGQTTTGNKIAPGLYEIELDYNHNGDWGRLEFFYYTTSPNWGSNPKDWLYLKEDKTQGSCGGQTSIKGLCGEYFAYHNFENPFTGDATATKIETFNNNRLSWNENPFTPKLGGLKLSISGDLTLEDGRIDVSGKGYPGGGQQGENGFGPGGGGAISTHDQQVGSGAGGYGGIGGPGCDDAGCHPGLVGPPPATGTRGNIYGDNITPEYGSGGGHAQARSCSSTRDATGGSGGGLISITADSVVISADSQISANGGQGAHDGGKRWGCVSRARSGGGSGGAVFIKANNLQNGAPATSLPDVAPGSGGGGNGENGVYAGIDFGSNLQARGGDAGKRDAGDDGYRAGGGGGGRIVIDAPLGAKITKTIVGRVPIENDRSNNQEVEYSISYSSFNGEDIIDTLPSGVHNPRSVPDFDSRSGNTIRWNNRSGSGTISLFVKLDRNKCDSITNTADVSGGRGGASVSVSASIDCKAYIRGDIYSAGDLNLSSEYRIDENSIIAGGSVGIAEGTSNKIFPYTLKPDSPEYSPIRWVDVKAQIKANRDQLKQERAKILGSAGNYRFNDVIWNLESSNDIPSNLSTTKTPEGGVWRVPGNLIINKPIAIQNRGTIIVEGNLTIPNSIQLNGDAMVGFIVDGQVTISSGAGAVNAIIFSNFSDIRFNAITIADRSGPLTFTGLLATPGNIKLPASGGKTSTFIYDSRFIQNPLPGFKALQKIIPEEVAP